MQQIAFARVFLKCVCVCGLCVCVYCVYSVCTVCVCVPSMWHVVCGLPIYASVYVILSMRFPLPNACSTAQWNEQNNFCIF